MKKILSIVIFLVAAYISLTQNSRNTTSPSRVSGTIVASDGDAALASAFANHQRNVEVHDTATVKKLLPDDNEGLRHQKFIVRLASGQTLLIAHDIDQAKRIDSLRTGDSIEFNGEYEWTPQGGVVHWTHHDSSGRHAPGWIKFNGQIYQ